MEQRLNFWERLQKLVSNVLQMYNSSVTSNRLKHLFPFSVSLFVFYSLDKINKGLGGEAFYSTTHKFSS